MPETCETPSDPARQFAQDIAGSLMQNPRRLSSRYLYDALGSALFEAICQLPWYRVTRAETTLLKTHGAAILAACHPLSDVVELGPGSGDKLACLLATRPAHDAHLNVHLIDVSHAALSDAATRLGNLPAVNVTRHHATYEAGLAGVRRGPSGASHTLALMLGSNIGNFDPQQANSLLREIHAALEPGDSFLLGADLIKPEGELVLAYDDPLGLTAAFNRNLLLRINNELGGDFDQAGFSYHAQWNAASSRVEAYLVSRCRQTVHIPMAGLTLSLQEGERIWTESAYKYTEESLFSLLEEAGFRRARIWVDDEARFALALVNR